jgi:hypothetical protein
MHDTLYGFLSLSLSLSFSLSICLSLLWPHHANAYSSIPMLDKCARGSKDTKVMGNKSRRRRWQHHGSINKEWDLVLKRALIT